MTIRLKLPGGYRDYDLDDESVWASWREAYRSITVRKTAEAKQLLEEYPHLAIADWAHIELISELSLEIHDFDRRQGDKDELHRIADELLSSVESFLDYRESAGEPTNCERYPGYWEFGRRKAEHSLFFAAEALSSISREAELSYLSEAEKLFPDNEVLRNLRKKLEAEDQPFELSFKDLLSEKSIDIGDYRGDVVLIDFWATWCQPCLNSIPHLKSLMKRQGKPRIEDDRGVL